MSKSVHTNHKFKYLMEFHVAARARERFAFDATLFSTASRVIFADMRAVRLFAARMNAQRDLVAHPELAVKAADINAMGLIDEALHIVVDLYRRQVKPDVIQEAETWLIAKIGKRKLDRALRAFVTQFPPSDVYQGRLTPAAYLRGKTAELPNRQRALEELLLLWMSNSNKAFGPYNELFDDRPLRANTAYLDVIDGLKEYLKTQPVFGPEALDLFSLLRQPALHSPDSLEGQIRYLLEAWADMLKDVLVRLLGGVDLIKEENKTFFAGPPPTRTPRFDADDDEVERFTADLDWMPRLVLLAKSALVWLDQLSGKYGRAIHRLDEIPDEELDRLASWGVTCLWLIGIWERSSASRKIKRMCGNPEAEASAYSLFEYEIAREIGGAPALQNLRDRCLRRNIRLGCDMVPNHTGIDSRWLREHPDWFISLSCCPFPGYSFTGANLSEDPRYGIYLEDHYYNQTDAAVVFKREDTWNGDVRYVYHGNDGTGMPWNDTAQLDYLNPEAREAVVAQIVEVARRFPVIRFDAAMTLAKKHFHRLWYPEPGSGGDIPTRSEHGLTKREFDARFPREFWREVVERVAAEVPDTLLLAEAFWFMEGYFVRTLGMHRVYNSAFMNMLKNEENEKYRRTVINTLQFDPEILKRYVNFMNNPDEETAIEQFGDGDKYFGVCTLLATMPGLPMFGHGQIEGFHEKYGMEYRRAYLREEENVWLVERHQREIFPLLKKRYLFAGVDNFLFYDFVSAEGEINENVFAYSNAAYGERCLIVYNNRYAGASGWIRLSTPFLEKTAEGKNRLARRTLGQGLALSDAAGAFLIFRDRVGGLEYLRDSKSVCEQGLYFELGAFKYVVVTEMREVADDAAGSYAALCLRLAGRGVESVTDEMQELKLAPFLREADRLLSPGSYARFFESRWAGEDKLKAAFDAFEATCLALFSAAPEELAKFIGNHEMAAREARRRLVAARRLFGPESSVPEVLAGETGEFLSKALARGNRPLLYCWCALAGMRNAQPGWVRACLIHRRLTPLLQDEAFGSNLPHDEIDLLEALLSVDLLALLQEAEAPAALRRLFEIPSVSAYTKVNRFEGVVWFNQECFEALLTHLFLVATLRLTTPTSGEVSDSLVAELRQVVDVTRRWLAAEQASEYKLTELLRLCQELPKA